MPKNTNYDRIILQIIMPITRSAKKALRQNIRRRARNLQKKRKMKNLIKEVEDLISQKKTNEAKKALSQLYKSLDKAAKTGIIKRNKAARKKSKITKLINKRTS